MKQQQYLEMEYNKNSFSTDGDQPLYPGTELLRYKKHVMVGTYDFSVQGGAVGTVNLKDVNGNNAQLPKGAIITMGIIEVVTSLTSGGSATVALGTGQSGSDLKAALAYGSYTGLVATIPVETAATSIKLTADNVMTATIATAALTAGKFNVFVEFYLSA